MKVIVGAILAALASVAQAQPAEVRPEAQPQVEAAQAGTLLDGVVAVVNGEVITLREVDKQSERVGGSLEGLTAQELAARRHAALEDKVREILVVQQAKELSLSASDSDVDEHVERVKKENNVNSAQLEANLKQMGIPSLEAYRETVRKEIMKANVVSMKVRSRIKVTDDEVAEVMQRDYAGGNEWEIHCGHVMVRVDPFASGPAHEAARKRLLSIREEIVSGRLSFADAARTWSEDVTAKEGGDLGWFTGGTLEDTFEKVAFTIQPGKLSDLVQTPFGYHLILVTERRQKPMSEERRQEATAAVKERLYQDKFLTAMKQWFEQLKSQAEIRTLIEL
jgi:parvulin-like peptidyl-prolyl isomerase